MSTILVTGANRGMGLEHVRQYAGQGETVIACHRPGSDVTDLARIAEAADGRVRLIATDVGDAEDVARLADDLAETPIDVLINNAGTFGRPSVPEGMTVQTIDNMDYGMWAEMFALNVMAPFRLTAALLGSITASRRKTVVMMSSDLGSIGAAKQGGSHAYRATKAALNMTTKSLANDLAAREVTVISMAPGWVRTEMGGDQAHWSVEDSVAKQQSVIDGLTLADTGRFINLLGEPVAW